MLLQLARKVNLRLVTTFYDNDRPDIDTFTLYDENDNVVFETNVYGRCQQFLLVRYDRQLQEWLTE